MTTGVRLYNADGNIYFSTDSQTWNYIGTFIAAANENPSVTFAALSVMSEVIFQRSAVDNPPNNQAGYIHTVSQSGTTITASGGNIRTLVTVLGR